MFKSSYFTYAGIYSGKYNLIMAYVNRSADFLVGASFEPIVDTILSKPESILYGLKHSDSPLEFEVDIVNPIGIIPEKQMEEINEWLFGQDGWKKLYIKAPDYNNIYLKCLFIPEKIIKDSRGYIGVRCKLRNISGFWYGEDKTITYTKSDFNSLTNNGADLVDGKNVVLHPEFKTQYNGKLFPIVKYLATDEDYAGKNRFTMNIHNNKTDYESDLTDNITATEKGKEIVIDCEYSTRKIDGVDSALSGLNTNYDLLFFNKGINEVAINLMPNGVYAPPSYLSFVYTPKKRVGGF